MSSSPSKKYYLSSFFNKSTRLWKDSCYVEKKKQTNKQAKANQNLCLSKSSGLVSEFSRLQKSEEFTIKKRVPQANT